MSFDRIGPYDLSRGDLVAAAIIVSFVTSPWSVRLMAAVYVLLGLATIVAGIVFGVLLHVGLVGRRCPVLHGSGAPGRIRTYDLKLRRLVLYPTELRARARREVTLGSA